MTGFAGPAHVDEFWRVGTGSGYRDDGPPGLRPALPRGFDGNCAEAVHHGVLRGLGVIDHLWIRVADVAAAKRFYETVAPYAGVRLRHDAPDRAQFIGTGGSFSFVAGSPSENVHLAFAATDNGTVEAFHRALIRAGYRDTGGPGERPLYHPGYYGAFVLDPDGNNVELVNHNR